MLELHFKYWFFLLAGILTLVCVVLCSVYLKSKKIVYFPHIELFGKPESFFFRQIPILTVFLTVLLTAISMHPYKDELFFAKKRVYNIVICLDVSNSMKENKKLEIAKDILKEFILKRDKEDKIGIVVFDNLSFQIAPKTSDKTYLLKIIPFIHTAMVDTGGTAMYDALIETLKMFNPKEKNKVIILLSDGGDINSKHPLEDVVTFNSKIGAKIYTIGISSGENFRNLEILSESSGGKAFFVKGKYKNALKGIFNEINKLEPSVVKDFSLVYEKPVDFWIKIVAFITVSAYLSKLFYKALKERFYLKVLVLFISLINSSYGDVFETKNYSVELIYPEKDVFFVKQPITVEVIVKSKKAVSLKKITIKPDIPFIYYNTQKYSNKNQLKQKFVIFFLKKGKYQIPFIIKTSDGVFTVKSQRTFSFVPVPEGISFVGDFSITTRLKKEQGNVTFFITISGRGFPEVPNHSLVVKNGSAKKIKHIFKNNLDKVFSTEVFRIVYMDKLEVEPVKFRYFDPFKGKIIEKKTEKIILKRKIIQKTFKEADYIKEFKELYPEYFYKKDYSMDFLILLNRYTLHILYAFFILLFFAFMAIYMTGKRLIPEKVLYFMSLNSKELDSYKKLYRFISVEMPHLKEYINQLENCLYKEKKPEKKVFNSILKTVLYQKVKDMPERKRFFLILAFHMNRKFPLYLLFFLFINLFFLVKIWKY